jgi:hypothetical protein
VASEKTVQSLCRSAGSQQAMAARSQGHIDDKWRATTTGAIRLNLWCAKVSFVSIDPRYRKSMSSCWLSLSIIPY